MKLSFTRKLVKKKKGQVFLVCTVIITIYMLSFINIIYELNVNQYTKISEEKEFKATYENFKTEMHNFIISLVANYSQPFTIIVSNATAIQLTQTWLEFAKQQMTMKGYTAIFTIVQTEIPFQLLKSNGRIGFTGLFYVYLQCNYMTIETQFRYQMNYMLSYVNTPTSSLITLTYQTLINTFYLGYAEVTVNGAETISYYNGTYYYPTPLVATNTIQAITLEQIIISYVV